MRSAFICHVIWFMLSALLIPGISPSAMAQEAAGEAVELLLNPNFNEDANEDGMPDHWSVSPERVVRQEIVFMGGNYELVSRPDTYVIATQRLTLEPGKTYTVSARLRTEEGGLGGVLLLHGPETPRTEMPLLWNVESDGQYQEFLRTFTAPNPACSLYIYNVARKGTVRFDRVSLVEGEPDHAVIGPFRLAEVDRPLNPPAVTPHIPWATHLPDGPLRTFISLRHIRTKRQALELTQRVEMDYDIVATGYTGAEAVSSTGPQATQRLRENQYDLYIIPSLLSEPLEKAIVANVEQGAGLVVVEGFGRAARFTDPATLAEAPDDHYVRRGVPWEMMPEQVLGGIQTGSLGEGRVVRLLFPLDIGRVWGLLPSDLNYASWQARQFEYWEWWEVLLARAALWAAKRDSEVTLHHETGPEGTFAFRVAGAAPGMNARVIVRSGREIRFDGPLLRTQETIMPLQNDTLEVAIPPDMPAGPVICDVMVLDAQQRTHDFGSFTVNVPQAVVINEITTDKEYYSPGDTVEAAIALSAPEAVAVTLQARLIDAHGRVTGEVNRDLALDAGDTTQSVSFTLDNLLCVGQRAFVRVLHEGHEHDSRWTYVLVPEIGPEQAAADFTIAPWGPGMASPVTARYYYEFIRELGMNAEFAGSGLFSVENGWPGGGYISGMEMFRETGWTEDGIRPRCLSDPQVIETARENARQTALRNEPMGLYAVGITDEAFLTSRHRMYEVCFGEHCLERFRNWLRGLYDSIEALNASWGTDFVDWNEVRGARSAEVRGTDNFAPFVDFRMFMTDVWVDACREVTEAYNEVLPQTPIGHTNTFGADPFNGNDYWKFATRTGFGWGQEYSEAIKGSGHKAIFELWRSFVETPEARASRTVEGQEPRRFFNYGWIGYDHRPAAVHYEPWWLALHDARGISYYATCSIDAPGGRSWSLVYPTLSLTPYSLEVKEAIADLRRGCGKLFIEYEREKPQVAILWSYPSMLVAWCESDWDMPEPNEADGTDSYGSYFRSALHFRRHVNELQLDYDYVVPEQIAAGVLQDYPVLFLPFTAALDEATVEHLFAYVDAGGVLVADFRTLYTNEHGTPFADSAHLQRLFGVMRQGDGRPDYSRSTVTFNADGEGLALTEGELTVFGRETLEAAGATVLAAHATGEPAVCVQRHGQGMAVYLNFMFPAFDVACRQMLENILSRAGIERTIRAENPNGDLPPRCYERNTFSRGPISVHGFIRDHRRCSDSDPVELHFGAPSHIYDIRAGQYLGHTASTETVVPPGHTALYAAMPYRVTGVETTGDTAAAPGDVVMLRARVVPHEGEPGDHVLHLAVTAPDGSLPWPYQHNLLAPDGMLEYALPTALSDPPGTWQVTFTDVLSGETGQLAFELAAR